MIISLFFTIVNQRSANVSLDHDFLSFGIGWKLQFVTK